MPSAKRTNFFGPWTRSDSVHSIEMTNTIINSNPKIYAKTAPNSPVSKSPLNSPPRSGSPPNGLSSSHPQPSALRRHFSSTFMLIPEDQELNKIVDSKSISNGTHVHSDDEKENRQVSSLHIIVRLILWWPLLIISLCQKFINVMMKNVWNFHSTPSFWLSALLWLFWKLVSYPLSLLKNVLIFLHTPAHERSRKKRTVLISGGSTIQALHLARNFHSAGARVIAFDFEGLFALARFSVAVDKFYTIPASAKENANDYVNAVMRIVEMEKPSLYIPVCATSPAYYDALAKPHMELEGVQRIFCPGAQEVSVLDDIGSVLKKCENRNIPVPPYRVLNSKEDLIKLYDSGFMNNFRNVLIATGAHGIIERQKYILPENKRDLNLSVEISEDKPWIVLRDVPGKHYVTCSTIKDSKVIANVTCAIHPETRNLVPETNPEIEKWLNDFFEKVRFMRKINGHVSFRFVKSDASGNLLTLGTRVGVTLSYLCYTGLQSRVVQKPCPHFERKNSGSMTQSRHFLPDTVANTIKNPSAQSLEKLIGSVLDKREALFLYWDPLPYIAFYHFQLPLRKVSKFLKRHSNRSNRHSSGL
ncbi:uncharacterized protein [Chironomus tepperi]|uniref:uncharacterized protein n=1 Tax=Chironomus tepperi TaxID=113505 RepID=UPI00391FA464